MTRRILLADDSVTIQKVIELTFMDEDYEVNAVSNGDEAVASLSQLRPDFVIADVHMPGANGYEVCRRSKALRPEVPVLLLVGTFEPFDEAQSRSAGADAFLKKPFDSQELLQLVGQLLAAAPTGPSAEAAEQPAPGPAAESPEPFPPGPSAEPSEPYGPSASPFHSGPADEPYPSGPSLGSPGAALEDTAEPFASADSEPTWSNFDLEAEPEPPGAPAGVDTGAAPWEPAADSGAAPWTATPDSGAAPWETPSGPAFMAQEPVFEVDEGTGGLRLDDEALEEVPPLSEAEAEGLALDDSYERAGWREDRAAAPEAGLGGTGMDATPEERAGVPLGAAPLASGLGEVEQAVAEHEGAPAFAGSAPFAGAVSGTHSAAPGDTGLRLSDDDVERIARRVAELVGDRVVRDVAWEVVPDMAELVIKDRLRELESQVD